MGKFIRYCKADEEHTGPNAFDVSRCSVLGNPYAHIKNKKTKASMVVKDRDTAINLYSEYFDEAYRKNEDFKKKVDEIYEAYKTYDEIYIGCYCKKNERCHGDIIIGKLQKRALRESIRNRKAL